MDKKINDLLIRYALLILIAIPNITLFYFIFYPLTIYPSFLLLAFFSKGALLIENVIILDGIAIELIPACLALSAYFLLTILNLATKMEIKKRIKSIIFSFAALLILNILRIFSLSLIYLKDPSIFDFTHLTTWYLLSVVFVVGIWFLTIKIFKIKGIPFFDDLKYLYTKSSLSKKHKPKKKSRKNK